MNPFKHRPIISKEKISVTYFLAPFLLLVLASCSGENSQEKKNFNASLKGEYIYRLSDEYHFPLKEPQIVSPEPYSWDQGNQLTFPKITKDFFRCKGSSLNTPHVVQKNAKEPERHFDCGGAQRHSLPLRDQKEFIYPILIDVLNNIQKETGKRVVITSGHRCPEHNIYVDPSPNNQHSKHMIGAEVSFYVQGMENQPEKIVNILMEYFKKVPKYKDRKEFLEFSRYEKGDTDVSTLPWYNKEIFIKMYKKNEGRNFDNRHPYPYVSVQVRYDYDKQEKVIYTWDQAFHNYLRW